MSPSRVIRHCLLVAGILLFTVSCGSDKNNSSEPTNGDPSNQRSNPSTQTSQSSVSDFAFQVIVNTSYVMYYVAAIQKGNNSSTATISRLKSATMVSKSGGNSEILSVDSAILTQSRLSQMRQKLKNHGFEISEADVLDGRPVSDFYRVEVMEGSIAAGDYTISLQYELSDGTTETMTHELSAARRIYHTP